MTKSYDHFFATTAIAGLVVTGTLYVLGIMTRENAVFIGVFLVVLPLVGAWGMHAGFRGIAQLDADGLTLRAGTKTLVYRWRHIADMRATNWANTQGLDGLWARLSKTDLNEPFVQLRLGRALRMKDLFSLYDTDGTGLPLSKTQRIFVANPATLVELATPYLRDAALSRAVHAH